VLGPVRILSAIAYPALDGSLTRRRRPVMATRTIPI
jgi:hypothetical protein